MAILAAGALVGVGVVLVVRGLWPLRPTDEELERLLGPVRAPEPALPTAGRNPRLGTLARQATTALGFDPGRRLAADLEVAGRTPEAHASRQLIAGAWLACLAIGGFTALRAVGVSVPSPLLLIAVLLAAGSGPLLATLVLRAEAAERREELRRDLALFLDLMVLVLAAGSGVETALATAAEGGEGWAWDQLREALRPVRVTAEPPWEALGRLGQRVGVVELEELAGAVALAVGSGGRMRESLAARAEALRARELARAQADAAAATERMTFPVVALAVGFLVVLGYPAVARVLASF